jgi:serine/threonine protein kinase
MNEVISAINFCHQKNIVHRDIKLENIMLRKKNDLSQGLVIIDFGIAG